MGYGPKERFCRSVIIWIMAIILIIASFTGILYIEGKMDTLQANFVIVDDCPTGNITRAQALQDYKQINAYQTGLMHCYCFNEIVMKLN